MDTSADVPDAVMEVAADPPTDPEPPTAPPSTAPPPSEPAPPPSVAAEEESESEDEEAILVRQVQLVEAQEKGKQVQAAK